MNTSYNAKNKIVGKPKRVLAFRAAPEVVADFQRRKELLGLKEDTELLAEVYREGLEPAFARLLKIKALEAQNTLQALREHSEHIKQNARKALGQSHKQPKARNA